MSGIWTPGNPDKPTGNLEILVPRGHERPVAFRCRVLTGSGVCGKPFYENERRAFEAHVGQCARENMDALVAESPRTRMPWSDPNSWDPEAEEHMRKVGARMRREGRLETRPNERIVNG